MPVDIADVLAIVGQQEQWRQRETINLIASENTPSRAVREVQNSDFMSRYAEGHPNQGEQVNRYYQGTRYIDQIETMAEAELKALLECRQVDVRPISGNAANTGIALGYLRGDDALMVNSTDAGGHISHGPVGVFGRRIQGRGKTLLMDRPNHVPLHYFPLTEDHYHIDAARTIELIEQVEPKMLVMGKSLFLFPEPVAELAPICREKKIPILFDAAHVLGLVACGQFQSPLKEGATWMTASTHKTFPGPQRGAIFADLDEEDEKRYWQPADRGVFPGSSSNHHLHTLPALVIATREMQAFGRAYAAQTVANAQAFGRALDHAGIAVEAKDFGYTRSHQVAVNVAAFGGGLETALRLEQNDLICNYNMLPGDTDPRHPSGLRLGVQEMTRFGMKEEAMERLAELLADAIRGKAVKAEVNRLRGEFTEMQYV